MPDDDPEELEDEPDEPDDPDVSLLVEVVTAGVDVVVVATA